MKLFLYGENQVKLRLIKKTISNISKNKNYKMEILVKSTSPREILEDNYRSSLGVYIICTKMEAPYNFVDVVNQIRRKDARAFIILISNDPNDMSRIFSDRLEVLDYILLSDVKEFEYRLEQDIGNINNKIRNYNDDGNHTILINSKNKIIPLRICELKSIERISRKRYILHTLKNDIEYLGDIHRLDIPYESFEVI